MSDQELMVTGNVIGKVGM